MNLNIQDTIKPRNMEKASPLQLGFLSNRPVEIQHLT